MLTRPPCLIRAVAGAASISSGVIVIEADYFSHLPASRLLTASALQSMIAHAPMTITADAVVENFPADTPWVAQSRSVPPFAAVHDHICLALFR